MAELEFEFLLTVTFIVGVLSDLHLFDHVETAVLNGALPEDIPEPVITGVFVVVVLIVWIISMILIARLLYRGWKMIDSHLFRLWDLIIPESTIIRFGIILTIFLFVFAFGPLVVIQWVGMDDDSDDIEQQVGINGSDTSDENETTNESNATSEGIRTRLPGSHSANAQSVSISTFGLPPPVSSVR